MKAIYSSTAAVLTILAGAALFRPHMMNAGQGLATTANSVVSKAAIPAQKMRLAENYGKLPLSFEANQGQTDSRAKFLSHGRGYSLFLTGDEAVLTLGRESQKANGKGQMSNVKNSRSPLVTRPLEAAKAGKLIAKDQGQTATDKGPRTPVDAGYVLTSANQIRFALGPYDHSKPLIIDPC